MVTTKTSASVTTRLIFRRRAVVRRHERLEPVAFSVPVMFPDRTSLEKIPERFIFPLGSRGGLGVEHLPMVTGGPGSIPSVK